MPRLTPLLALAILAASAPASPLGAQAAADAPRGHLMIVGGGPRPAAMREEFVRLAGGPERARIVVLPMASANAERAGESEVEALRRLGVSDARSLVLTREQAMDPATARQLDGVTGIWFPGGVQTRLTTVIGGTPLETAIRERYHAGAIVGGTSAGAAIMTTPMITGDERRPGGARPLSDDSRDAFVTIDRDNVVTVPGFALLPGAIVDQHFVRRRRHNRLVSLVLEHPTSVGLGIDESTALLVSPDGLWRVIGESVVVVYDAREAAVTPDSAPVLGAADVRMHVLPAGSVFDPRSGRATLPAAVPAVPPGSDSLLSAALRRSDSRDSRPALRR